MANKVRIDEKSTRFNNRDLARENCHFSSTIHLIMRQRYVDFINKPYCVFQTQCSKVNTEKNYV